MALSAPFTVDCSTDGGTTWSKAEWLADKAPDADASADTPVTGRLRTAAQPAYAAARKPFIDNGLMTEAGKGTAEAPYDLSRGGETANCYIVDDHGYYSIPLFFTAMPAAPTAESIRRHISSTAYPTTRRPER